MQTEEVWGEMGQEEEGGGSVFPMELTKLTPSPRTEALVANPLGEKANEAHLQRAEGCLGPQANNSRRPVISTPPTWVLLGWVSCEAIPEPALMPNYASTDWTGTRLDLSLENLDHWLIFSGSFLSQILLSCYPIWCVRGSAGT